MATTDELLDQLMKNYKKPEDAALSCDIPYRLNFGAKIEQKSRWQQMTS